MAKKSGHGGARPGAGRPKADQGRDDITVKLNRALIARARFVAESKRITLAEYLTESLRPVVARDFAEVDKGE